MALKFVAQKPARSESLTIRLDPKTRFILDFMARLRGQTITTVVERSIYEAVQRETIVQDFGSDKRWQDYWDVSEGIRSLKISDEARLFPTFDEERRLQFASAHWQFFYHKPDRETYRRVYIDILWPNINEYMEIFESKRSQDYFAAGIAMRNAIKSAGVSAPIWPPVEPNSDDDIPF